MSSETPDWFKVRNVAEVPSPSLLVYSDRVEENIQRMIRMAGGVPRLRPHIKTHKLPEVMERQLRQGITRFKCATIAEAEMAAKAGAPDLLLAYQPVGPNVQRLRQLTSRFPTTQFSAVADDLAAIQALAKAFAGTGATLPVYLDVDCGMHRTGVVPGPEAIELYAMISQAPGLKPGGLHAYDGHIHDSDVVERTRRCQEAFAAVAKLKQELIQEGWPVPAIVAGGTPTFPMHAQRAEVECSPGTCLFWDAGYQSKLPDLDFLPAALVLSRVVSKPGRDRLCLDLGHKAIASENPHPRVRFFELPEAKAVTHSEEHLVLQTPDADRFAVGDAVYGMPWHICPTVALYSEAVRVSGGLAGTHWKIEARRRTLTI